MSWVAILAVALALAAVILLAIFERRLRADFREEQRRGLNPEAAADRDKIAALGKSCLSTFLLGFAPTILLVLAYKFARVPQGHRIFVATAIFGAAVLATVVFRLFNPLPQPSRLPWRNLLIVLMAGLTVVLHDGLFIKIRPTVTNIVGAALAIAALSGLNPRLDTWFERHRHSLAESAWRKLLLGAAIDELLYAALNVYIWRTATEAFWIYFQLWGPPLFFASFALLGYLLLKDQMPDRCAVNSLAPTPGTTDGK